MDTLELTGKDGKTTPVRVFHTNSTRAEFRTNSKKAKARTRARARAMAFYLDYLYNRFGSPEAAVIRYNGSPAYLVKVRRAFNDITKGRDPTIGDRFKITL